jgi:hypothetical protein
METDLERELAHHLYHLTAEYERQGYSHEEAARLAKREFGGREQVKEQCREQRRWAWLAAVRQDVVFGARMLRRSPVITIAAIVSLALGIGANTVIFSAVHHVVLSSLPYPESQRLFAVWGRSATHPAEPMHVSAADFYDWRTKSHTFESLAAYAKGASPLRVFWLLLRQTMLLVLAGIGGGLLCAWWLSRWLENLLFAVRPHDPATFGAVAGVLILVSLAAALVPGRRAMKIDPNAALRTL